MLFFQILIAVGIVVGIMYGIEFHEDRVEQEERRAANREHTLDLFIRNRL
jgi:hypothetical protein